ncbi:hypothetical protein BWI15_17625 [Kribbella sp. ALI-6-A]|uniref:hypothetical protein n=1 Tax=Kribbella sp. ALI-6-A TaxID=1933817 RepID=UPI00097C4E74|nr:hypothetical protein [Kribbella sp. ALI-6-A]ONI71935.1 hypothetical protein BWI15_17625 [Kribbella sp. ALI-6-A]
MTGDDLVDNHRTKLLRNHGATTVAGNNQIPDKTGAVVASTTVELLRPADSTTGPTGPLNEPIRLQRLKLLQHVFERFGKDQIAIIGSVGRSSAPRPPPQCSPPWRRRGTSAPTSTTRCAAHGSVPGLATTEACEYQNAYLALSPKLAMIFNISPNREDHFWPGTEGFAVSLRTSDESSESLDHIVINAGAAAQLANNTGGTTISKRCGPISTRVIGSLGRAYWQFSVEHATPEITRFALSHTGTPRPRPR